MSTNENTGSSKSITDNIQFLTVAQTIGKTSLSRATIFRYIKKNLIPAVKIGRRVLIDAAFLSQLKTQASISCKEVKA